MIDKIILVKAIVWGYFIISGVYTHVQLKELTEKQDALIQILNAIVYDDESSRSSSSFLNGDK